MKHMKRILALALALMLTLGLATTAFAADGDATGYTVTINGAAGHNYVIYQIFTGELSKNDEGKDVLANIKYGEDYVPNAENTPEDERIAAGDPVPDTVLENFSPDTIVPTGAGKAMTTSGDTATISGLAAGYYMIKDMTEPLPDSDTRSAVIFQVVENTTVTSKHTGTTIVKKVQDINDSTGAYTTVEGTNETWIDSADYDINDTVPFKSTSNFEGMDNYKTYKVVFTDIMAPGLTYQGEMDIYVNGQLAPEGEFTIETSTYTNAEDPAYNGGTQITVTCDNIKGINGTTNNAEIVLVYNATLNTNAKFGAPGNPNKIRVKTFPDGEGDNETPWDVNIVFTYKLESNKYANQVGEGNELKGAGFTLFKWIKNDTEAGGAWVKIGEEITGPELTKFEWKGIDDGKYKLEETTTPTGYNTIDPIEFEVKAEHVIVAENPTLTNLTGTVKTGEVQFTAMENNEGLSTNVINNSGTVLPETGGIGTTIFYVVGGLLAVAAVVLLVTKKRMTTAE